MCYNNNNASQYTQLILSITAPRDGEKCERRADGGYEAGEEELEDSDFYFIEGILDRLRIFDLQFSAETELPCSDGSYCSNESICRPIDGELHISIIICIKRIPLSVQILSSISD